VTEEEWLLGSTPDRMLTHVAGTASPRKLRLFAVACCRRIWHRLADERSRQAILASEGYADGRVKRRELVESRQQALLVKELNSVTTPGEFAAAAVARPRLVPHWVAQLARTASADAVARAGWVTYREALHAETRNQAILLREVLGNPFCPIAVDPAWLAANDGAVRQLAESIYEERAFDRLPILADALEDAGCAVAEVLDHCRTGGEHVRGCWVVDLILGRGQGGP
jgi:hypothetical protein